MKKLLFFLTPFLLLIGSCRKDLTSLNVDPKNPTTVPPAALFTNAQRELSDLLATSDVNTNIFWLIVQYWQETTYTDESKYDIVTRQIPRQLWDGLYRDIIMDFGEAKRLIPTAEPNAAVQKNQLAITEIMEVQSWYYLVTTFGDVPYSEALDINNTAPKYDNQQTIYNSLITRLDDAIASLNTSEGSGSYGASDIIYGGDPAMWKKYANSLKLKMALTIADVDETKAKTMAEAAVQGGVFESNNDNGKFTYTGEQPFANPLYEELVVEGRKDYVAATTFVNALNATSDLRRSKYLTTDASGGFSGLPPGVGGGFAAYSKPSETITDANFKTTFLDYSEVEFMLAEAKSRNFNVPGTAEQHYRNGVTASFEDWGFSAAQATSYLGAAGVAFDPTNWKKSIGAQKWFAMYVRPWDSWIEVRRLDNPALPLASGATSGFPVRFTYPVPEQNVNKTNYTAASAAIGGDKVETKLFWDKF